MPARMALQREACLAALASRRAGWTLLAVVAMWLSGCAQPSTDQAPATTTGVTQGAPLTVPTWALGDAWVYEVGGERATYVVSEDLGAHWRMDTDSASRAFQDAVDDISRLGPQRKVDLAGSQGSDVVEFIHWPLEAGKSWSTTWDQVRLTIKVLTADAKGAELEGRAADGTLVYHYRYDAAAKWFGALVHYAPDGSEMVRLTLADAVHGWKGTIVRWSVEAGPSANATAPKEDLVAFPVPSGVTDLWVHYRVACGPAGLFVFNLAPRSGQGRGENGPCPAEFTGVYVEHPVADDWGLTAIAGGANGSLEYQVLLRTRQDIPFGST